MKYSLSVLLLLTACGVKGAPAPRAKSAYIFSPVKKETRTDKEKKEASENEEAKRRSDNRTDNPF